ncbi:MAG: FkbM family methyltransferase [Rhodospirillales bacterium]|nr:FkbM family methyltransferase [Rhodospirillales bacterium]
MVSTSEVSTSDIFDALALLTPVEITDLAKVRVGRQDGDGGYVMADRFRPDQKVYSYGVSDEMTFDLDLAERGLESFLYDYTIARLVQDHPRFRFRREGISGSNKPNKKVFTLEHHIAENGHTDGDMILKMDVEGAEWDVLRTIDPAVLTRFEQIIMELHRIWHLDRPEFYQCFCPAMEKLREHFHLFHVHANNAGPIRSLSDLPVASPLEISLLRKDLSATAPWQTIIPSALDAANSRAARPDHVLNFFPFLPQGLEPAALKRESLASIRRANIGVLQRLHKVKRGAYMRRNVVLLAQQLYSACPELADNEEQTLQEIRNCLLLPGDDPDAVLEKIRKTLRKAKENSLKEEIDRLYRHKPPATTGCSPSPLAELPCERPETVKAYRR